MKSNYASTRRSRPTGSSSLAHFVRSDRLSADASSTMATDDTISRLRTPEECLSFEKNALLRNRTDLAKQARRRAIQLRAETYGAKSDAERVCLEAIYAYERVLTDKNGRTTRASRTWQMIERHGIIEAVERAVNRRVETVGYTALVEKGLEDFAFEAVILRHPEHFSKEAIERSRERIKETGPQRR